MPERIQRQRTKGWRMPPGAVYVGRPTKWGNPWQHGEPGQFHGDGCVYNLKDTMKRPVAVLNYIDWLMGDAFPVHLYWLPTSLTESGYASELRYLAAKRQAILDSLADLRGRDLVCWCPLDAPCHADVLLEFANA